VYLDVLATRPRAQHVYEKLGFLVEGRRRQARFEFGQYVDVIELPLMRDDYRCGSAR
jgi:RimJ/RimL family protein N-acetyltransferase